MTAQTTNRLRLRIRDKLHIFLAQRDPLVVIASLIAVPLIGLLLGTALYRSLPPSPLTAVVPTRAPIILIATAPAQIVPTPAAQVAVVLPENVTRKAIVVYGDHDLATAIGAVEAGRAFSPVARWGLDWTQVDMDGSGRVFVRTTDLYGVPELADLQPPPAPVVVYQVVNQPARCATQAVATLEPQQYAVTSAPDPQLSERQRNIQERLVDPSVAQQWAQQQWRDEHCIGGRCIP